MITIVLSNYQLFPVPSKELYNAEPRFYKVISQIV